MVSSDCQSELSLIGTIMAHYYVVFSFPTPQVRHLLLQHEFSDTIEGGIIVYTLMFFAFSLQM